jgi:hypothetical protein
MTAARARVRSALVGVLMSVGLVGAPLAATPPSTTADASVPTVLHSRQDRLLDRRQSLIRSRVDPPSPDFTTYIEGELVRVSIPSNWRELPGFNAVTFAPEGAYGNAGVRSVFTHGVSMGLARNDKRGLEVATDEFIDASVLVTPSPTRTLRYGQVAIGGRLGLHTVLSSESEATGEPERIETFTTLLRDGTLFYVLAVVPRDRASDYAGTFQRVVDSIQIMDGDLGASW